ncbi:MAG: hypothetical protein ACK56F_07595, partial [bacterium]
MISQGKGNTRPDPERQTGKSVESELGKETHNCNSMKFPKPRTLSLNDHDDLSTPQPKLFKELVNDIIFPPEGSPRDRYLQSTIDDLKERSRKKSKAIKLNQLFINRQLYFLNICLNPEEG